MPLPKTKKELLENLQTSYKKLDDDIIKVLDYKVQVKDILAYQIGWGKLLLSWESDENKGKIPDMPAKGYKWNQLGILAKSFYEFYQSHTIDELRKEFHNIIIDLETMISNNE